MINKIEKMFNLKDIQIASDLEILDNFKDLPHLVNMTLKTVSSYLKNCEARFYVFQPRFHEYREIITDGLFTIPEDSIFISYIAMKKGIIDIKEINEEIIFQNDELLSYLFGKQIKVKYFVPIVHKYRLLGFISLSYKNRRKPLNEAERIFLKQLTKSLKVNLHAASLIEKRLNELLIMTDLAKKIQHYPSYDDLLNNITNFFSTIIPFDRAIFYEYNEFEKVLVPRSIKNVEDPPEIEYGKGISGMTFKKKKPELVNNIKDHIHFNDINIEDFITNSFISVPIISVDKPFGVLTISNDGDKEFAQDHLYIIQIICAQLINELENKILIHQLDKSYFETISSLTAALEAKDKYTKGHSERVMQFSVGIAKEMGLSPEKTREIRYASILHDIGKIGISKDIINKTGNLTEEEFRAIKEHTKIGFEILSSIDFLENARKYVKYHHERIDGSGYHGKSIGEYPWEAMIISLSDSFDALTSKRSYRNASTPEEAIIKLKKSVNKQFRHYIFHAFIRYLKNQDMIRADFKLEN